jgi:hypothetical protein
LTIDGGRSLNYYNRVFDHTGKGTLSIDHMTLTDAKYKGARSALGGCIYSAGYVAIYYSAVTSCSVKSTGRYLAAGGGIAALNGIRLNGSLVSGNVADAGSTALGTSQGGGIYAYNAITMVYSTVTENIASGGLYDFGGGIEARGKNINRIFNSTISGNNSSGDAGGLFVLQQDGYYTAIADSTISGNNAAHFVGGVEVNNQLVISNSTIAFNTNGSSFSGAGLYASAPSASIILQSSIIALNSSSGGLGDVRINPGNSAGGANNLITQSLGVVPADTIIACPLLGPLGDNGGKSKTHRLLADSPAIDAGNDNQFGLGVDQRGTGFPRTVGTKTDIGAFESHGETTNEIFSSEFENRCN